MSSLKGMRQASIELTPTAVQEHGYEQVEAIQLSDGRGDGWLTNNPNLNGHLSGSVIEYKRVNTEHGPQYHYELVPFDNVMKKAELVGASVTAEAQQLNGQITESGTFELGEIDSLIMARATLVNWLTLGEDAKKELKRIFSGVVDARQHSTNYLNQEARTVTSHNVNLQDDTGRVNPLIVASRSRRTERVLAARSGQVARSQRAAAGRARRLAQWLRHDNNQIADTHEAIEKILLDPSNDNLAWLGGIARHVRFYIQPYNHLAYEVDGSVSRVDDPDQIVRLRTGLLYSRSKNYLATPFRQTAAASGAKFKAIGTRDELIDGIGERMEMLEEMPLSGSYTILRSEILKLGEEVMQHLQAGEITGAKKLSERAKKFITFQCYGKSDPNTRLWYGQILRI